MNLANIEILTIQCPNCCVGHFYGTSSLQPCGFCNNSREVKYINGASGLASIEKALYEFKERERKLKYQEELVEYYREYGHLHPTENESPIIKPETKLNRFLTLIKDLAKPVIEKLFKEKSNNEKKAS